MKRLTAIVQRENVVAVLLSAVTLAVYWTTMSRTVSFVDSGELAAVVSMLGIAHPTGYPLFTLLGRCAAMVPLAGEEVVRLNVLAALLTAASVGWFFKTSVLFYQVRLFSWDETVSPPNGKISYGAAVGSLILAFSSTVWSQSASAEVYSLHLLLLVLTVYAFVRGVEEQNSGGRLSRFLLLFALLLGLGFSNHMTTLLLAPAFLYVYFAVLGARRESFARFIKLAPFFLSGLSLYLYLPVRASATPPLDWGHPAEFDRFFWHVSGKQYRSWMFSSFESAERQLQYFLNALPTEFHYVALGLFALGLIAAIRQSGRLFLFVSLLLLGCLLYAINYDIHDIDSYFLLAYLAIGWLIVFGLSALYQWSSQKVPPPFKPVVWVIVLALPALQWWSNRERVDQSENYLAHDYTQNILANVEPNAFILTYQWDYFVSASYYFQHVRRQRPDVVIIDKELLRRSWYYLMLERNYPWLIERSKVKVDLFLAELYKFEHGLPLDPAVIEARFNEMINDFIDRAMEERPVYVGNEIEPQFAYTYQRIPEGLLFRLLRENETPTIKPATVSFRPTTFENDYTRGIKFLYARMLTMNAALMMEQHQAALALDAVEQALEIDSTFPPAHELQKQLREQQSSK